MGRIVIVAYRPHAGKSAELRSLVATHVPRLRQRGLAPEREAICMEAADGTLVEVFEWTSAEAIQAAHGDEVVQAMWSDFAQLCDYIPIGDVSEADMLFSEFTAIAPTAE